MLISRIMCVLVFTALLPGTKAIAQGGVGLKTTNNNAVVKSKYYSISNDIYISISDPEGVYNWEIYEGDGTDTQIKIGNGECEPSIEVIFPVTLKDINHSAHSHKVQFTDCAGNTDQWIANNSTKVYKKGKQGNTFEPLNSSADSLSIKIDDVDQDAILDIIVVKDGVDGLTTTVFTGIGDGTFNEPLESGQIFHVPNTNHADQLRGFDLLPNLNRR